MLFMLLLPGIASLGQQTREQLANHYFNNGEYEQAAELYEGLYKQAANKYYYQMLYRTYMGKQDYKAAEKLVEKRMKQNGSDLYLYVDLGGVSEKLGEGKKAEKAYNEAVNKLSGNQQQLADLVTAFEGAGKLNWGEKCYLKVREKTGNKYAYINELAALYEKMGNYEKMMGEYFDLLDRSPGSLSSVQVTLQRALNQTGDKGLSEGLRRTLVNRVQGDPGNKTYLDMLIWFSLQEKDFAFAAAQAKAVDARFAELQGESLYKVGTIAHKNREYAVAAECYGLIMKKGEENPYYYDSRVGLLAVKFERLNKNYQLPKKEYESLRGEYERTIAELGKKEETVRLMRNYAELTAYYGGEVQKAADMLDDVLEIPRLSNKIASEVKLELGDLLLFAGEVWDASLMYMQVEKANKNDVIGAQAKFRNARLSYFNHDFEWAKSQLEVLRASTSKLVANDAMELSLLISDNMDDDSTYEVLSYYATADLLLYRNMLDSAWVAFEAVKTRALSHPIFDEVLMQEAKIRMKQGRYEEADELLERLVKMYGDDVLADKALMMRGELNEELLGRPDKAKECYEKVVLDYSGSVYAEEARKRYKTLR